MSSPALISAVLHKVDAIRTPSRELSDTQVSFRFRHCPHWLWWDIRNGSLWVSTEQESDPASLLMPSLRGHARFGARRRVGLVREEGWALPEALSQADQGVMGLATWGTPKRSGHGQW